MAHILEYKIRVCNDTSGGDSESDQTAYGVNVQDIITTTDFPDSVVPKFQRYELVNTSGGTETIVPPVLGSELMDATNNWLTNPHYDVDIPVGHCVDMYYSITLPANFDTINTVSNIAYASATNAENVNSDEIHAQLARLQVSKTSEIVDDNTIRYTIAVENIGNATATNVHYRDILEPDLVYVSGYNFLATPPDLLNITAGQTVTTVYDYVHPARDSSDFKEEIKNIIMVSSDNAPAHCASALQDTQTVISIVKFLLANRATPAMCLFDFNDGLISAGQTKTTGDVTSNDMLATGETLTFRVDTHPSLGLKWENRGSDIDGEAKFDLSGYYSALSSDGNVVAIGATGNDDNGNSSGHVRVYEWNVSNGDWEKRGSDIDGEFMFDQSGSSVSLSSDGNFVAIGAVGNDDNGNSSGHVRVYEWNVSDGEWEKRGSDIDGENADDESGWSVSLSSDGNIVAIGAIGGDKIVRVYEWNVSDGEWKKRNDDENDFLSGSSVSLSSDGNVIAIGDYGNDENGENSGHVRVYEWDVSDDKWEKRGLDIYGENADDESGYSVSLSSDGNVVAIGAANNDGNGDNSGHVRVYEWNVIDGEWEKRGSDIDGEAMSDLSGWSVALSSDGNTVAIGAVENGGDSSGHVRVYEWNVSDGEWEKRGLDIDGENAFDSSGGSVSLSSDGNVVAIGAAGNRANGTLSGHVRVYEWGESAGAQVKTANIDTISVGSTLGTFDVTMNSNAQPGEEWWFYYRAQFEDTSNSGLVTDVAGDHGRARVSGNVADTAK